MSIQPKTGTEVCIVCDWQSDTARFVEAEIDGKSVSLPWRDRADGLKELVIATAGQYPGLWSVAAALRTMHQLGYTYHGGAQWKPPIGPRPDFGPRLESALTKAEAVEPVAGAPDGWLPTDDEIDALTDHLYRSLCGTGAHNGGMVGVSWNRALFRKALQVAARNDAAGVVPDGWRDQAASWLESKAAEQEINNRRWPAHADAYPSWRERPEAYRILARELRSATPPTNQEGAAP